MIAQVSGNSSQEAQVSGNPSQVLGTNHVGWVGFLLIFQMAQLSQTQRVSQQPAGFPFPLKA